METTEQKRPAGLFEVVSQERMEFLGSEIAFIGDPRHCVGMVELRNPLAHPVRLRTLRVRVASDALSPVTSEGILTLKVGAKLRGGELRPLRVPLSLPLGTPPGRYDAHLDVGEGRAMPVTIEVLELRDTRLLPDAVSTSVAPGATIVVRMTVHNGGNVSVEIPTRAALALHEGEGGWPQHFHAAAKSHGKQGHQAFLDAFVKKLGHAEPPLGRARITLGAGALAPQASRLIEVELALPKSLRAGHKYLGAVRVADTIMRTDLHVSSNNADPASADEDDDGDSGDDSTQG